MEWKKYDKLIEKKLKLYTKFDWILLVFVDFLNSMSAYTDELFQDESHHPPPDGKRPYVGFGNYSKDTWVPYPHVLIPSR
jgi:hypothetical protein